MNLANVNLPKCESVECESGKCESDNAGSLSSVSIPPFVHDFMDQQNNMRNKKLVYKLVE